MKRVAVALVPLLAAATAPAHAQSISVTPSVSISQMYDDNLFSRPAAEADTITRVSPRFDAQYRSEFHTFSARYALDADRFDRHPDLTTAHARQDAGFEEQYHATPSLSLGGAAAFMETETPADLNVATALTPGRARAQRLTVHPSAAYQLGWLTSATFGYIAAHDRLFGVSLLSQTATAAIDHHASARDGVRWEYSYQNYLFNAFERKTSQAVTAQWTRDVTRATSFSVRGGLRITGGTLSPDAAASLHHAMRIGEAALAYAHTQTTLLGLVGVADTHTVTARVSGEARSGLQLHVEPGLLRTTQTGLASTVYRLSVGGLRPIGRRLGVEASYDLNLQRGNIYAGHRVETIGRHVAVLKLVANAAKRARR
jgi:hypothetical protein